MKRQDWEHKKLQGIDADIETSLKGYGIAWIQERKETLFYYGVNFQDNEETREAEYYRFDFCTMDNNTDPKKEYDWVDWDDFFSYIGAETEEEQQDWIEVPLQYQIFDLLNYYGYENVFGSTYWEGLSFDQVINGK